VFQNHYLPVRFGFDKRRPHLSSLIVSGQLTRDAALQQLAEPLYEPLELENDLDYLCKKLSITRQDLDGFLAAPHRHHSDYPNFGRRYRALKWCQATAQRLLGRRLSNYS
jgi:hypothetical protein